MLTAERLYPPRPRTPPLQGEPYEPFFTTNVVIAGIGGFLLGAVWGWFSQNY
jgi:hypothetical protein